MNFGSLVVLGLLVALTLPVAIGWVCQQFSGRVPPIRPVLIDIRHGEIPDEISDQDIDRATQAFLNYAGVHSSTTYFAFGRLRFCRASRQSFDLLAI